MKAKTLIVALVVGIALLLSTAQSRQEPLHKGRHLSQDNAAATAMGSGDSGSTTTDTSVMSGGGDETSVQMPTVVTDGNRGNGPGNGAATTTTTFPTATNFPCIWPFCHFPPNMPPPMFPPPMVPPPTMPPPVMPPPVKPPPPPPHKIIIPIIKIPIFKQKEIKVIITPPKPVPQIPLCMGKIKEICCDSKDFCPWNWMWFPDKDPPKVCKVEVDVIKELKVCQWPVLVFKDEFDFTCKCPVPPKPCQACDVCCEQTSSASADASASASASSGGGGY